MLDMALEKGSDLIDATLAYVELFQGCRERATAKPLAQSAPRFRL